MKPFVTGEGEHEQSVQVLWYSHSNSKMKSY